jgi:hypothetical protein
VRNFGATEKKELIASAYSITPKCRDLYSISKNLLKRRREGEGKGGRREGEGKRDGEVREKGGGREGEGRLTSILIGARQCGTIVKIRRSYNS